MANYKGIKGFKVQSLASDPTLVEGQVWYNTTGSALKYLQGLGAGAWASGGAVLTPRNQLGGAGRSQTAGLIMGGIPAPTPGVAGKLTESYDGTSWTEVNDLGTGRYGGGGTGTQTGALFFGGATPIVQNTEAWDGTSWTEVADLAYGRYNTGFGGVATNAFIATGDSTPTGGHPTSEEWTQSLTVKTVTVS